MEQVGRRAWQLFRVLIALIALACIAQVFLAGRGVFGISSGDSLGDQSSFDPHRVLGNAISVAAIIAFVLAVVIWQKGIVFATFVLALLAAFVQRVTTSTAHPWVGGLHALSGITILGISGSLAHRAWRRRGMAPPAA